MSGPLWEIVRPHLDRPELAEAVAAFYAEVARAVASHEPVCENRGLCCRFGEYGHALYVTSIELVYFVRMNRDRWAAVGEQQACPYHVGGVCTSREARPLGCRVFFCDPDTRDWQSSEYERGLSRLRSLCTQFGVAYRYAEWLSAIRDLTGPIGAHSEAIAVSPRQLHRNEGERDRPDLSGRL